MGRQYGFYFDGDRCVQCHACEVACKSWNDLELGISWRRVRDLWSGAFPNVVNKTVSLSCMHCAKPSCMEICPAKAISKRVEDGIVIVDQKKCQALPFVRVRVPLPRAAIRPDRGHAEVQFVP